MGKSWVLIYEADRVFREAMLIKWGAPDRIKCCTCHHFFIPDFIDVGHILGRARSFAVRWYEPNVLPQCRHCNRTMDGNNIVNCISAEEYQRIFTIAHDRSFRLTDEFIQEVINKYTL